MDAIKMFFTKVKRDKKECLSFVLFVLKWFCEYWIYNFVILICSISLSSLHTDLRLFAECHWNRFTHAWHFSINLLFSPLSVCACLWVLKTKPRNRRTLIASFLAWTSNHFSPPPMSLCATQWLRRLTTDIFDARTLDSILSGSYSQTLSILADGIHSNGPSLVSCLWLNGNARYNGAQRKKRKLLSEIVIVVIGIFSAPLFHARAQRSLQIHLMLFTKYEVTCTKIKCFIKSTKGVDEMLTNEKQTHQQASEWASKRTKKMSAVFSIPRSISIRKIKNIFVWTRACVCVFCVALSYFLYVILSCFCLSYTFPHGLGRAARHTDTYTCTDIKSIVSRAPQL